MMGMMGCGCLGRWFWDGVVVGCDAPPFCPPRSPSPWPSPAERERGFSFLPSRPSLGSRFRGMGLRVVVLVWGVFMFCEGALRFLRGAWAVHERPVRGGVLVSGWGGGCLPCPALLPAPVTLALALSRCCWVFCGRGDSPSSPPVHPWVPAPVSGYGASFGE